MPEIKYTTDEQIEMMRKELLLEKNKAKDVSEGKRPRHKIQVGKLIKRVSFYGLVALLLFMLVSVVVTKKNGGVPTLFGFQLYVVESGSMSPTLKVGAVILSQRVEVPTALQVNDIVTFKTASGATVTHRIIEVIQDENGKVKYRTKGDNPINSPDPELLDPERIVARFVAKVPYT